MADMIVIVILAAAVLMVMRGRFRKRGSGQCGGGCPGCGGSCGFSGCVGEAGEKED